jgi:hypothetical protein
MKNSNILNPVIYTILLVFAFSFVACDKDESAEPNLPLEAEVISLDATSFTEWVYVSLSKGEIVEVSDPQNDMSWDLGFHRWDVRTNGGMSGKGQGAALQLSQNGLDQVDTAPETGYVSDVMLQINMTGMPPVYEEHPANPELAKWMDLDMSEMPPKYTMTDKIFIVRTADGSYARLKFTDYMNDTGTRGHITFEYVLQPDGSRTF